MFFKGQYVRMKMAPNTRFGTIADVKQKGGRTEYLFRHDSRFADRLPDFFVYEDEIEAVDRPTDEHVHLINRLIQRGT